VKKCMQRIIVICNELPYPPIHGGRLDAWNQIAALTERNIKICLICWYASDSDLPNESTRSAIKESVDELVLLPISKGPRWWIKRLFLLTNYPWFVSAMLQKNTLIKSLIDKLRLFNPDLIFLVSIYGSDLATKLSHKLKIPLVVRSQNIEHQYQQILASQAITTREKMKLRLAQIGLERYELMVLSSCDWYFDISLEDLAYWKGRGLIKGEWLPTFINIKNLPDQADLTPSWDVVYLGNLNSPNNVQGVIWFCKQVVPMLRQSQPGLRILVAGSNPTFEVEEVCTKSGVVLLPNPASASKVYRSGRVLVNIAPKGSGVSTKSIEMLLVGVPVVTTPQGIRGLPDNIKQYFYTASTVEEFTEKVIDALARKPEDNKDETPLAILDHFFGDEAVSCFEARLLNIVNGHNPSSIIERR